MPLFQVRPFCIDLQRLPELPIGIPAAALQKAASQALSLAESLRTPDGAISKQGSSGGQKIRPSTHQKVRETSGLQPPNLGLASDNYVLLSAMIHSDALILGIF